MESTQNGFLVWSQNSDKNIFMRSLLCHYKKANGSKVVILVYAIVQIGRLDDGVN